MSTTGELIRLINYVEDITTTLHRITASVPTIDAEEKKRLAEALHGAGSNLKNLESLLEKGQ